VEVIKSVTLPAYCHGKG